MFGRIIVSIILTLTPVVSLAQTDTMSFGDEGLVVVWDSSKTYSFTTLFQDNSFPTIWGNPDLMMDRWVLDSGDRLISRMINNNYGFTYYEWHNNGLIKIENVKIRPYNLEFSTYLDSKGQNLGLDSEGGFPFFTIYQDSGNCIESIHIQIPIDSIIALNLQGTIDTALISTSTKFYAVFRYNSEGYLIANGYEATSLKNTDLSLRVYQKFGQWNYFNARGEFVKSEILEIKV